MHTTLAPLKRGERVCHREDMADGYDGLVVRTYPDGTYLVDWGDDEDPMEVYQRGDLVGANDPGAPEPPIQHRDVRCKRCDTRHCPCEPCF